MAHCRGLVKYTIKPGQDTNGNHRPLWNRITLRVMPEDPQHFTEMILGFPKCFTIFSQPPSISRGTRHTDVGKPYNMLLPENSCNQHVYSLPLV